MKVLKRKINKKCKRVLVSYRVETLSSQEKSRIKNKKVKVYMYVYKPWEVMGEKSSVIRNSGGRTDISGKGKKRGMRMKETKVKFLVS